MRLVVLTFATITSCTTAEPSLSFIDVPASVHAPPKTQPDLVATLEAGGFDGPVHFRIDNFTNDTVVVGEIVDRATVTIVLAGCFFGEQQQANFLMASIADVSTRADVSVVCLRQ